VSCRCLLPYSRRDLACIRSVAIWQPRARSAAPHPLSPSELYARPCCITIQWTVLSAHVMLLSGLLGLRKAVSAYLLDIDPPWTDGNLVLQQPGLSSSWCRLL
jgi:hypothetical protein